MDRLTEAKNESSNRRRFFRKLVGLAALTGIGGASLAGSTRKVYAADGDYLMIGNANSGSGGTGLTASPAGSTAFNVENTSPSTNSIAIYGVASASTGDIYGIYGASFSISGRGVHGSAAASTGFTYGVSGNSSSPSGIGVYGLADTSTGDNYGVYGQSNSISGKGVFGYVGTSTGTTYGVHGLSHSIYGMGVYGSANASTGDTVGVYGNSASVSGRGVAGYATRQSGTTYGVHGESTSVSGRGVRGYVGASTGTTYGVWGESASESGRGVYGWATRQSGTTYGVYGKSDSAIGVSVIGVAGNAGAKPMVARGTALQTANLQEWQDFSSQANSVINSSGFLGIGTSSPSTPIHVKSSSSNPAIKIENEVTHVGQFIFCYSNSNIPFFSGRRARGTMTSPAAVQTDDVLMRYGGAGYGTTTFPPGNKAILEFKAAEAWTDTAQGTYITFSTTPTGLTGTTERMRITSDGAILPPSNDTGSIGKEGQKWNLVRATTVTSGDLVFENGVKATEEGDGLAFINKSGEKIAALDHEGNLRVKGKLIEGL